MLGAGEGIFYPAAIKGATEWFAPKDRAKAIGLFLSGLSVGTLLTPPIVAWIVVHYGWRSAFVATGGIGFLILPPWLLIHRRVRKNFGMPDPAPAHVASAFVETNSDEGTTLGEGFKRRKYLLMLVARALTDVTWYFYLFWIPGYFQEVRGFDAQMVGQYLWAPYFGGGIGALTGAWASSALMHRGWGLDSARKSVLFTSASLCLAGPSAFLVSRPMAIGLVAVGLFGCLSWSSNLHTAITEISPKRHAATLYGITGAAGALAGAISQPLIGRVVDIRGYTPVLLGVALLHILAAGAVFGAGRIEPYRCSSVISAVSAP
jgi:ACS family hexuronate transporter-like MFS transporter